MFWKRCTQVRVEGKGECIPGGKNKEMKWGAGAGVSTFTEEEEDTTKWRRLFVSVGYELELAK